MDPKQKIERLNIIFKNYNYIQLCIILTTIIVIANNLFVIMWISEREL